LSESYYIVEGRLRCDNQRVGSEEQNMGFKNAELVIGFMLMQNSFDTGML
jgi:hypothetical protein